MESFYIGVILLILGCIIRVENRLSRLEERVKEICKKLGITSKNDFS
jgi:hypothetical protein